MQFSESDSVITIVSPVSTAVRLFFACGGLAPLIAPYELLYSVQWTGWFNIFFIFSALISAGAVVLSVLLILCAIVGLDQSILVDSRSRTLTYTRRAPIILIASTTVPFEDVRQVGVVTHKWSDGPDSYSLELLISNGRRFSTGSIDSCEYVERCAALIRQRISGVNAITYG